MINLRITNNKKGSALLWVVLMTIVVTILLGAIMSAVYAYFSYTTRTIKRQQAYFTARSAMAELVEEFSLADDSDDDANIPILPKSVNEKITATFDYSGANMGTAEATILLDENDTSSVNISVVSTFADQEYKMNATMKRQPIYFGGVAVKSLVLNGSNFELLGDTDLYFYTYKNDELKGTNKAKTFDTTGNSYTTPDRPVQLSSGSKIIVEGNLITQGNAILGNNITIAGGQTFNGDKFGINSGTDTGYTISRKIWNANQFVISNKTMEVEENLGTYSTSFVNALTNALDTHIELCNNKYTTSNVANPDLFGWPGSGADAVTRAFTSFYNGVNAIVSYIPGNTLEKITNEMFSAISDGSLSDLALTNDSRDSIGMQYLYILSMSSAVDSYTDIAATMLEDVPIIGSAQAALLRALTKPIGDALASLPYKVKDISYIEYDNSNVGDFKDSAAVTPVTYLLVQGDNSSTQGTYVRVRYGSNPEKSSDLFNFIDNASSRWDSFVDRTSEDIYKLIGQSGSIAYSTSYVIVYLGKNTTLELGAEIPTLNEKAMGATKASIATKKTKANQIYYYSIYGQEGSTVILNDQVTLVGEVMVDNLVVNGNVSISYSATNGAQVAKQKVAEIWAVSKYYD